MTKNASGKARKKAAYRASGARCGKWSRRTAANVWSETFLYSPPLEVLRDIGFQVVDAPRLHGLEELRLTNVVELPLEGGQEGHQVAPRIGRQGRRRLPPTAVAPVLQVVQDDIHLLDVLPHRLGGLRALQAPLAAEELVGHALALPVDAGALLEVEGPEHLRWELELPMQPPAEHRLDRRRPVFVQGDGLVVDLEDAAGPVGVVPVALFEVGEQEPVGAGAHQLRVARPLIQAVPQGGLDLAHLGLQRIDVAGDAEVAVEGEVARDVLVCDGQRGRLALVVVVGPHRLVPRVPVVDVDGDLHVEAHAAVELPPGVGEPVGAGTAVQRGVPGAQLPLGPMAVAGPLGAVAHHRDRRVVEQAGLRPNTRGNLRKEGLVGMASGGQGSTGHPEEDARVPDPHAVATQVGAHPSLREGAKAGHRGRRSHTAGHYSFPLLVGTEIFAARSNNPYCDTQRWTTFQPDASINICLTNAQGPTRTANRHTGSSPTHAL